MKSRLVYSDGTVKEVTTTITESSSSKIATLTADVISGANYVDFMYDYFTAQVGDDGYFITNWTKNGTYLTRFKKRDDAEISGTESFVGCYGWCRKDDSVIGIVKTMRCDFGPVLGVKDGKYYTYLRFYIDGDAVQEDINVEFIIVNEPTYSAVAKEYRRFLIEEKGCISLKDRCMKDSRLKKAAETIEVRVRQGWKPSPSPVPDQTPETEPPMHVACTFERVGDIAEAFKNGGITDAEFCLVGWNTKGHDGRFPQIFPVESQLGGEAALRDTIKKVKALGYSIVCHDDATAAYKIADCYDEEYLLKNKDGSLHTRPFVWSGGRPYKICPKRQYEKFELSNQEKIAELGFEGIHYIDVMTILPVLKCYDANHPLTRFESAQWYKKIMELSRKNFGGFASESGYDFAAESMDYCIYADFQLGKDVEDYMCDESIPFWHIVYHGIMLYNPSTFTLNYAAKGIKNRLKCIEVGGRPLVCYYANFDTSMNWMGKEDFFCETDEQLNDSVCKIKTMWDDYALMKEEIYEFIDEHRKIADNVYETVYSNGTRVVVDYNVNTFEMLR